MNLPGEILFMISGRIGSQRDRIRLLSVCRRWHNLLFRKVCSCLYIEEDFDLFDGFARLDVSFFQNPHLALAVREFVTGGHGWTGGSGSEGYKHDIDRTAFHLLLEKMGISSTRLASWKDRLDNNDEDIWLPILIIMMKNLRVLGIGLLNMDFLCHVMTLVVTRQKPFDTDPPLQHLEEVRVIPNQCRPSHGVSEIVLFTHLPVRVLKTHHPFHDYDSFPNPSAVRPAPGSSGITELYCTRNTGTFSNGSNGFADLIIACKNLRVFEYRHNNQSL